MDASALRETIPESARAALEPTADGARLRRRAIAVGGFSLLVLGFLVALGVPRGFEEALRFILPGYFAGLLVAEMKGWATPVICLLSVIAAVPGALASAAWGWIISATVIASLSWGFEEWKLHGSKSS